MKKAFTIILTLALLTGCASVQTRLNKAASQGTLDGFIEIAGKPTQKVDRHTPSGDKIDILYYRQYVAIFKNERFYHASNNPFTINRKLYNLEVISRDKYEENKDDYMGATLLGILELDRKKRMGD